VTAANVVAFYAEAHWGSRYGVVDAYHPTPHKGLDCGLFHGVVDVPALHDGTVVAAAASASVGHYVTVQRGDGLFDTYCHIVIGVSVGQRVVQGQRLGRQAVTQAEGGADWRGQHTHLCLSRTRDGWAVWGYVNLDPTPGVIAVLTGTASDGSTPIPPEQPKKENYEMSYSYIQRPTGPGSKTQWALLGVQFPDGALVTQDVAVANGWAALDPTRGVVLNDAQWEPTLNAAKIASDDWKAAVAAVGSDGGSVDLAATNALLTELLAATVANRPLTKIEGTIS